MKKIFWELVSFWGTLLAGLLLVVLAFVLEFRFGMIVFLDLFIITLVSNTWKVYHFKARPDNPEKIRPERPFHPIKECLRFLKLKDAIAYFHYVDAGSFPSIHSARSFNQAFLFAAFLGAIHWYLIFLAFAALVAWSRVVKMRHFRTDITAGAILGLLVAVTSCYFAGIGGF